MVDLLLNVAFGSGQPPASGNGPKWHKIIQLWDKLCVRNGILYHIDNNALNVVQLVVPKSLQDKILSEIHEGVGGGHLGVEKSVAKLKERFYWPRGIIMISRIGAPGVAVAWLGR